MKPAGRDALLTAIVKARGWIDDIRLGRIASFAEISKREGQGERHRGADAGVDRAENQACGHDVPLPDVVEVTR